MLVGLLNIIFNILIFLINIASWIMLIYVIMTLIIPQNKYTLLVGKYAEPVLAPIRVWLAKTFPKLSASRIDISPLVFWLLLEVAGWLVQLLRNILL
ncbi:MAG: YggT family protein [Eubacteriales bacterium]|nr:YggT family protein [Eubacteriales bacterium]MDD3214689.1 YggT family protein [Eubacteriales bacterium]